MKLTAVGFTNFRSIGDMPVWLDLTNKVNLLIGPNNSGKSNIFRALYYIRGEVNGHNKLDDLDRHRRENDCEFGCYFRAEIEPADRYLSDQFREIIIGCTFEPNKSDVLKHPFNGMEFQHFNPLYREHTGEQFTSRPTFENMPQYYEKLAKNIFRKLLSQIPEVHIVPDIRKIDAGETYEYDGRGIIGTLASWQIPKLGNESFEEKFLKLNNLLQKLLHTPNVSLEVPPEKDVIIVRRDGLRLPLAYYGTGIHELIILAIAVSSRQGAVFCIEEPEIHLHPLLQKELMRFLIEETDNQYVLSSHSHALMNLDKDVNIVHLWQEDGVTKNRTVQNVGHALDALHDLGIHAGDLLQARSVVWVEGPSDRIYLNRWLSLMAPQLREGIDYSVMFYGGKLLSHLSASQSEFSSPEDLILLLRINQHSAILIDSDRSRSADALNETKVRVQGECAAANIPCWITKGREIENYLPVEVIRKAYTEITGQEVPISFGNYGRLEASLKKAYGKSWREKWSYNAAKVDMAHRIAPYFEEKHISEDLRTAMDAIITMIQKA